MTSSENEWYHIENANEVDSPALVVYADRVRENIRLLTSRVNNILLLRPHVKTNKMAEVCQMMLEAGIQKFKCATIAEAEMLALLKAPDVLLAYQPVGPKISRLLNLIKDYPATSFSCLVDHAGNAREINEACVPDDIQLKVYLDLNVGMNRTGIHPDRAFDLFKLCVELSNLSPVGLHSYDGHITETDTLLRRKKSDDAFLGVNVLATVIAEHLKIKPVIVAGGSPAFAAHLLRHDVELSPGTFVFWDWGYKHRLPDEPYSYAALVISRVVSIVDEHTICTDLGHKSVAAENPFPRVHFLNAPDAEQIGQSEEHLVLKVPDAGLYTPGDLLYGVPVHICPTVALYDKAMVVQNGRVGAEWDVVARNRRITI